MYTLSLACVLILITMIYNMNYMYYNYYYDGLFFNEKVYILDFFFIKWNYYLSMMVYH